MINDAKNLLILILAVSITALAIMAYYVSGALFSTWTQAEGTITLLIGYAVAYLLWNDD